MSSYSSTYPSVSPTYQIDFSNGGRIPPNATFSRSDSPIDASKAAASAVHFWSNEKHLSSENLLLDSKTGTGNWTALNVGGAALPTVTADHAAPPSGGANAATRVQLDLSGGTASGDIAMYYQNRSVASGTSATFSVWLKATDGTSTYAAQIIGANGADSDVTITGSWQKFTVTGTSGGANDSYGVRLRGSQTPTNADTADILMWGANLSTTGETVLNATTTQIHREYAPTLKSVATAGQARFEYDPTDGQSAGTSLGISIESQSTNLATYGSDLTNAAWNPLSAFIGGTAVGPDGTLSAVKLVASAGSSLYPRFRRLSLLTDTTQTFSIYVKPLEFQHLVISADGSASCLVQYNLSGSGAITSQTGATGSVEQCGNGWFRVSFSYTTVPNAHLAIAMQSSTTYQTETGNGYDGMLFALAQLENQSFASSFIGTTSSTATRAADSLSADLTEVGFTGGPVSVAAEFNANSVSSGTPRVFALKNGNNLVMSYITSGGSLSTFADVDGSTSVNTYIKGGLAANTDYKMAISYGTDDYQGACGGDLGNPDTACALPDLESGTLYIGESGR